MSAVTMRMADTGTRSLPKKRSFTVSILKSAFCPPGKDRAWFYDSQQPGLALMVTGAGSKAFYVYRKVLGRPQRIRLEAWPDISIEQARKLAQQIIGDISKGRNPMADKRAARAKGMNLGELWSWYLESCAKPLKRSWLADESRYNHHLKSWERKRLSDITTVEVAALYRKVAAATSYPTAKRVVHLLSAMFKKARQIGWENNPCKGVEMVQESSRERFLGPEELKRFFTAIETSDSSWQDFFKLCLFTGARRGNVLSMRWDELNLPAGQWSIPGEKFKNKKPVVVHLPAPAIQILESRQGNGSDWVFPGTGATGHLLNPAKPWADVCDRAKLKGVRIHDLRRTMGSWLAAGNISSTIIGKVLGHRSQQATAVYTRLTTDALRGPVDAAAAAMVAAGQNGQQATQEPAGATKE